MVRALLGLLLLAGCGAPAVSALPAAQAVPATSWTATCTERDEPTLWWALLETTPPPQPADFSCANLFLDGYDCNRTVAVGKLWKTEELYLGRPVWQVRYLPYGDAAAVVRFLDRVDQGVVFVAKLKPDKPGIPAEVDPEAKALTRDGLFLRYLTQREKSSALTTGLTMHIWNCPEDSFEPPEADIAAQGMSIVRHFGKFVLR